MDFVIVLVILAAVVAFVSAPLRRGADTGEPEPGSPVSTARLDELEALRDAKYREIRDAELDHLTGKLSDEDHAAVDSSLRAEAIEILRAIDTIEDR